MDARRKEIKRILAGVMIDNGSYIAAAESVFGMNFRGVSSGQVSARLFGVSERKRIYVSKGENVDLPETSVRAFDFIGRPVMLMESPDEAATIAFPFFCSPYIMTAKFEEDRVNVCFYTARSLFSFIKARKAFSKFRKYTGFEEEKKAKSEEK